MKSVYVKLYAAVATLSAWHDSSRYEGCAHTCIDVAHSLVSNITREQAHRQYGEQLGNIVDATVDVTLAHSSLHLAVEGGNLHNVINQATDVLELMARHDALSEG